MISLKNILKSLSLLLTLVLMLTSCTQRRGEIITGDLQSGLSPWGALNGIDGYALLATSGDYVYAIGAGGGFGEFYVPNQYMDTWYSNYGNNAVGPDITVFNDLIRYGFDSVFSMVAVEKPGQHFVYASSPSGLFRFSGLGTQYKRLEKIGNFQLKSMVYLHDQDAIVGFYATNMYVISLANGGTNSVQTYSLPFNIGTGHGAAYYQGRIYVAAGNQLAILNPTERPLNSIQVCNPSTSNQSSCLETRYQAVDVATAGGYLFIQHQGSQAGIYIFNSSGANVKYMALNPISFAPYLNGSTQNIFANVDDQEVGIYSIR